MNKKKRRKRSKALFEDLRAQDGQGATFFSPIKIRQAKELKAQKEQAKVNKQHNKKAKAVAKKVQRQLQAEETSLRRQQRQEHAIAAKVATVAKARKKEAVKDTH